VIDTPIVELGTVGAAIGMGMAGLRPVVEVMTWTFALLAADQILAFLGRQRLTFLQMRLDLVGLRRLRPLAVSVSWE
jgi:pyruvate/2-oxoglutarate/acetoin dehydrogenase E1 component